MGETASKIYRWFDERMGLGALRKFMWGQALKPVPGHVNWFFTLGTAAAFLFFCQIATGVLLAFYYQLHFDHAYDSVRDINSRIAMGWLIRSLHHWGSHLMVFVLLLHMIRVFCYAGYKKPRELTWIVGAMLFFAVVTLCFTGTLLPMDQLAYVGTTVATASFDNLPLLGNSLVVLIRGGETVTGVTLSRFFVMHILILPAAVIVLIALHIFLVRKLGISTRKDVDEELRAGYENVMAREGIPFYPGHAMKEILTVLTLFALLVSLSVFFPAGLGEKADPLKTDVGIRPEWYFLPVYQIQKYFPKWLGIILTNVLFAAFLLLPFLDRTPGRVPARRKGVLWLGAFVLVILVLVGVLGALAHREMTLFGEKVRFDNLGFPRSGAKP